MESQEDILAGIFFSYSHADEALRDQLEKQLSLLKRQGVIETWHDRRIGAGREIARAIDEQINRDEIILLLVSSDFLASDYCYDIEMKRAMARHEEGSAIVIPVILRACDWHGAPFGKLNAAPRDGKPITQWPDIDEAFLQVAKAIREAVGRLAKPTWAPDNPAPSLQAAKRLPEGPRSSNLRLAKTFTQRDKDQFRLDAFEYMARFFENSLGELAKRNAGVEGVFRRVDANRFFATVYRHGHDISSATIYLGDDGGFGRGINYIQGHTTASNSINDTVNIEADDQSLYLAAMGMMHGGGRSGEKKLSPEGAAEYYWANLIRRLQEK